MVLAECLVGVEPHLTEVKETLSTLVYVWLRMTASGDILLQNEREALLFSSLVSIACFQRFLDKDYESLLDATAERLEAELRV